MNLNKVWKVVEHYENMSTEDVCKYPYVMINFTVKYDDDTHINTTGMPAKWKTDGTRVFELKSYVQSIIDTYKNHLVDIVIERENESTC